MDPANCHGAKDGSSVGTPPTEISSPYCWWQPEIRRENQLRLVVEIPLFPGFYKSQVVFLPDFWTINTTSTSHHFFCKPPASWYSNQGGPQKKHGTFLPKLPLKDGLHREKPCGWWDVMVHHGPSGLRPLRLVTLDPLQVILPWDHPGLGDLFGQKKKFHWPF